MNFAAPIPGMSLTGEKGNATWEQPPLYADPIEAFAFYMKRLEDDEALDDILYVLEEGMPLETLVDSMTSYGVMEGYHTIDVKMIVAPVIHEHLMALCEAQGITIREEAGPTREERDSERQKKRMLRALDKALNNPEPVEELSEEIEEAEEVMGEPDQEEDDVELTSGIIPRSVK